MSLSSNYYELSFVANRKISTGELKNTYLDKLPGFKINWKSRLHREVNGLELAVKEPNITEHKYVNDQRRKQLVK